MSYCIMGTMVGQMELKKEYCQTSLFAAFSFVRVTVCCLLACLSLALLIFVQDPLGRSVV